MSQAFLKMNDPSPPVLGFPGDKPQLGGAEEAGTLEETLLFPLLLKFVGWRMWRVGAPLCGSIQAATVEYHGLVAYIKKTFIFHSSGGCDV